MLVFWGNISVLGYVKCFGVILGYWGVLGYVRLPLW